jgi:hypothetical protein
MFKPNADGCGALLHRVHDEKRGVTMNYETSAGEFVQCFWDRCFESLQKMSNRSMRYRRRLPLCDRLAGRPMRLRDSQGRELQSRKLECACLHYLIVEVINLLTVNEQ